MKQIIFLLITLSFFSCKNENNSSKEEGIILEWNFDKKLKYKYNYFRNTTINFENTEIEQTRNANSFDEGKIILNSIGNSFADLSLKNVNIVVGGDVGNDTMTDLIDSSFIRNINSNGAGFNSDSIGYEYKLLLQLPTKPIEIGEKEEFDFKIPFTWNGGIFYTKGTYTLTYLKNGKLNDTKCAILLGSLDVSNIEFEVELMEAIEDGLEVEFSGEVKQYFDITNKCLLGADIKLNSIFNSNKYNFMNTETIMSVRID